MALTFKSFQDVRQDMIASLASMGSRLTNLEEGARTFQLLTAVASAVAQGWIGLSQAKDAFFISNAVGTDLDRRVEDLGMRRNQGAKATGSVLAFVSAPGTVVPVGTILRVDSGSTTTYLEVLQTRTLVPPYTALPVSATQVGAEHDLPAGTLLTEIGGKFRDVLFRVGSEGVDAAGSPVGKLTGGLARESDEELKARVPDYLRNLSRATLPAVRQALQGISGLSTVVIENCVPGPGYITISVANSDGELTAALRAQVKAVLDEWLAAGVAYLLQTIETRDVSVRVRAYITDPNLRPIDVQNRVTDAIRAINRNLTIGRSIYMSDIWVAAKTTELLKVEVLAPTGDAIAAANELLSIGSVTVIPVYVTEA